MLRCAAWERPLYLHQDQPLKGRALEPYIVVATGTGSEKTEAFLIPILDYLLREQEAGTLAQPVCAPCCYTL